MGIAAGDYDNDGAPDVAAHRRRSVAGCFATPAAARSPTSTAKAGLGGRRAFSTSAMWFDYDKDGRLDLLICNYVQWTPQGDVFCSTDGKTKSYCTPEAYRGSTSWLYRNKGDGTFDDVTAKAGFFDVTSKSLGVTLLDYDQDGWPDVFIANDTQPNKLYRNNGNGTFAELGLKAGVAFSEEGRARAGMGVDAVDLDGSGRPTVAVTNFSGEMLGLFRAESDGQYVDRAPGSDIGRATRQTLGWGCFFFDVDLDGQQDLLVVNGRLDAARVATGAPAGVAADTPHLFRNANGRFTDIARDAGATFAQAEDGPRRRLRRHRRRRRSRRRDHDQRRPGAPLSHRPAGGEPQRAPAPRRHDRRTATASARAPRSASGRRPRRASSAPDRAISRSRSCR